MQVSDYYRSHGSSDLGGRNECGCNPNSSHGRRLQYLVVLFLRMAAITRAFSLSYMFLLFDFLYLLFLIIKITEII